MSDATPAPGDIIRAARLAAGLTLRQVGEAAGLTEKEVQQVEVRPKRNGKRLRTPSLDTVALVARAVGIPSLAAFDACYPPEVGS